jgi:hypothetical protein
MYFTWTDRSLCESGFVFDRKTIGVDTNHAAGFAPTYEFESPDVCYTKHSPTSIFDDLTVSKVPPGTIITYCIRATNDVGYDYGYRSEPACLNVTVAWEASVRFAFIFYWSSVMLFEFAGIWLGIGGRNRR